MHINNSRKKHRKTLLKTHIKNFKHASKMNINNTLQKLKTHVRNIRKKILKLNKKHTKQTKTT